MFFKKFAFLFIVFFVSSVGYATPASEIVDKLNNIKSMQANFTQITYDNYGKPVQTSTGKMMMVRPGRFRWHVLKPIPQLIIANNVKMWIFDPDLEQVTIRHFDVENSDAPALLLSQPDQSVELNYEVSLSSNKADGLKWYQLLAKKEDAMFEKIQLGFKSDSIQQMRLSDHLGHTTQISFDKIEFNKTISANYFNFKPKAGIDVIDETK